LTPRKKRSAALALVRVVSDAELGKGSEIDAISAALTERDQINATFEPETARPKRADARQLARREELFRIVRQTPLLSPEWTRPRGHIERFAMLSVYDDRHTYHTWISTHESPEAASDVAAEDDAEAGFKAVDLYDLDTGDRYQPVTRVVFELRVGSLGACPECGSLSPWRCDCEVKP
jgi:hypothetical protein